MTMLLVVSSAITTLIKLLSCDKGASSTVVLPLAVAAAASEMPRYMMAFREWAEARSDTVVLIADFKRILITLLNQNNIDV